MKRAFADLSTSERIEVLAALRRAVGRGDLSIGAAIRVLRAGYLAMPRARFAQLVGVSPAALAKIETDEGNPTVGTLEHILRPFGMRVGLVASKYDQRGPELSEVRYEELRDRLTEVARSNRRRSAKKPSG